jgi:serine/threonine protein kinase
MPRRFETPLQASGTPEVPAQSDGAWSRPELPEIWDSWKTVRPVGFLGAEAFREVDRAGLLGSSDMQACLGCGADVPEAGRFCPTCGSVLTESGSIAASVSAATPAESAPAVSAVGSAALAPLRDDPSASLIGYTVGDFAIEAVIGGGSFGTVYRGRQLGLDRPVAIKVPSARIAADPIQAKRFAREARAAARVIHPGVVAIYAVGELDDGRPYLAMQLIDGESLDRSFAGGPVPTVRALHIARAIASALAETHAAGVVHRDLKPSNIMWRRDRHGDDLITLVDFGIAVCRPGNADATRLTIAGLIGTPHYMSPEQAQGEHVDGRADLYALGCVVFELVTGATPFEGSGFEVLLAHLGRTPPLASSKNPAVPDVVDRMIARLMAKKPDDRPASADAVVELIDDALRVLQRPPPPVMPQTIDLAPPPRSPRASEPELELPRRRSHRAAVVAIGLLALLGAGFAAYRFRGADEPEPAVTPAGALVSATGEPLRLIPRDDGELIVKALVPEVIHANVPIRAHLEIQTKLGGALSAKQVVVTIEDPQHRATGQTAERHGDHPGHYAFHHTFSEPGSYVVRIFPSETETVSTIELDVVP